MPDVQDGEAFGVQPVEQVEQGVLGEMVCPGEERGTGFDRSREGREG